MEQDNLVLSNEISNEDISSIISNQNNIIENLNILIDYLVPSTEELEQLRKQSLEDNKNEEEFLENESKEKEQVKTDITEFVKGIQGRIDDRNVQFDEYNQQLLSEIKQINSNLNIVDSNTQYSNNLGYFSCVVLVVILICVLFYKILKRFFY